MAPVALAGAGPAAVNWTNFQFLHPAWLALLPAAWLIVWLLWRCGERDSMWQRVCEPHLLRRMRGAGDEQGNHLIRYWLIALVLSVGAVAAAGPSWTLQRQNQAQAISARVLVLELSRAMLVEDVRPDRFSAAVETARELLDSEFDGETGLVVYAGAAFVVAPLSRDANALQAFLDALDPSTMPLDGSRVDLALNLAHDLLAASPGGTGQILVIGSTTENPEASLQAAVAIAGQRNTISVLAVGNAEGGPLRDPAGGLVRDGQGRFVISKPDFAVLQGIAEIGGGRFINTAESALSTGLFIREAGTETGLRERTAEAEENLRPANDGHWLIWLMLPPSLLLFRRNQLWLLLVVCVLPLDRSAQAANPEAFWQHREHLAHEAFSVEDYARVLELSRDPVLRGSALYRLGSYQDALDAFADGDTATAHYNRGNALAQMHRFAEAILAFGEALRLDPAHAAAEHNRRLLEYFLEQQSSMNAAEKADGGDEPDGDSDLANTEARIGMLGKQITNPGEDPEGGAGLGASIDPGQVDLSDNYDGSEPQLERFSLPAGIRDPAQDQAIEAWIRALPQSSAELYRRKFLRDYQRQTRQER